MGRVKKNIQINLILGAVFLILSVVYVWPFSHHGIIFGSGDLMFHANRMEELYKDIQHGVIIPRIATYSFNRVGSGINFFYPWIFLYPFVIFRLITHNPIVSFYLGIILINFVTLWIAYYSMMRFSSSRVRSLVFAIVYSLANYRLYLIFNQNVLAEALAYTFMPLVLLSFYEVFFRDSKKWPLFGIGMTFLVYSHMLTTALIAIFCLITLIIFWYFIGSKKERIIAAIKAALLALGLSSFYIFPFIEQTLSNKLVASWKGLEFVQTPASTVTNSLNNSPYQFIGFMLILTILFGFTIWSKVGIEDKYAYISGILLVVLTTTLIPWAKFIHTPLATIQFPYRLNGIASLLLCIYLSKIIQLWICNIHNNYHINQYLILLLLTIIPVGLIFSAEEQITSSRINLTYLSKRPTVKHYYPLQNGTSYNLSKDDWGNQLYYFAHNGSFDYFPVAVGNRATQIAMHMGIVDHRRIPLESRLSTKPNEISYNLSGLKAGSNIVLPILYYKNVVIKVGQRRYIKPKVTRNALIQVTVPKQNKKITVKYKNSFIDIISLWISVITWLGLIGVFFIKNRGKK